MKHLFFFFSDGHEHEGDTDSEGWEEREASRTHSVKFSEDSMLDKDTPFIRQNTPHPRELKLKAHKLFGKEPKGKADDSGNLDTLSEEVCCLVSYVVLFSCVYKNSYFEHDVKSSRGKMY